MVSGKGRIEAGVCYGPLIIQYVHGWSSEGSECERDGKGIASESK